MFDKLFQTINGSIGETILFILLLVYVAGSGCIDNSVNQTATGVIHTQKENTSLRSTADPNKVPIETAYNQSLAEFWRFAIEGPYSSAPNWVSASLDPEPVILYDINGRPQYYEFYLRNKGTIPGYFWTAANKLLGHGIFRLYEGPPSYNHSRIALDAEDIVKARYPDYPVLSNTPALYSGGYPHLCAMVIILNTTAGANERIIVDAFTHEIVSDHPSEDYNGHEYAWSCLDSIPQIEYPARIAQWELQDSNASRIVNYAMAQGIDVRLPLSEQDTSILRNYYASVSPGSSSPEPDRTPDIPDDRPITEELINENVVTVETARIHALAYLWRCQLDDPEIHSWPSYRNATLNMTAYGLIEDINGRKIRYTFPVERGGVSAGEIVVGANRMLSSIHGGTARGDYDYVNASRKAWEIADRDYQAARIISERHVSAIGQHPGVWVILLVEQEQSLQQTRIGVNTQTFDLLTENVTVSEGSGSFSPGLSAISRQDANDAIEQWEKEDKKDQDFITHAKSHGIRTDRPLSDKEIVTLGTYIFKTEPRYPPEGLLYNPLYPQPAIRPTLDTGTRGWHEQADWFSAILVDASIGEVEAGQILSSHSLPGNYTVNILTVGAMGADYYLEVPEPDYNRTFSILKTDGSAEIREQVAPMWEYVQIVKRKNGSIIIPVAIGYPEEANAQRLIAAGVPLKPMREVYIQYDYAAMPKKSEREKALAELNADDRVLFAFKEYPS
ncbi:MAG: hypothetical protein WC593_00475 [Methanoregula sp.]